MESMKYRSATVKGIDKEDFNSTRTVTFIASTDDVDGHSTRLNQEGWKLDRYKGNPIIGYQHNVYGDGLCEKATPDDIIGRGKNIRVEEGQLMVDIEFKPEGRSEIADKVAEDVRDGYLNSVSVGFVPVGKGRMVDEGDREVYHFEGQELLEISVVNIPSNPNANAVRKNLRDQTARGIMWVYKALGGKKRLAEIEGLTIRNIMDLLEGKEIEQNTVEVTELFKGSADYTAENYDLALEAERLRLIHKQRTKRR